VLFLYIWLFKSSPNSNVADAPPILNDDWIWAVLCGIVTPIPNLVLVLSQLKFADCINVPVPFPINSCPDVKVAAPIPPRVIGNVPLEIFVAFNAVKPAPEPIKLVALKVFEVLFQLKFADCINVPVPFPINILLAINVVVPIPPRATVNVPLEIFVAFNAVKPAPEPIKLVALKVFEVLFQLKFADCINVPVPFPINILLAINVVVPIPPRVIGNVPLEIFDAFNADNPDPIPVIIPSTSNVVFGFVLPTPKRRLVLSHTKSVGCSISLVPLPISTDLVNNEVVPVPPRVTGNVPLEILDAFNKYNSEPLPVIIPDNCKLPEILTLTSFVSVPIITWPPSNILKHISPTSWTSIIGSSPVWFIINAGPVPSFVINTCSEVDTSVFTTVVVPFTVKLPSIRASPNTCNLFVGSVVPIPILLYIPSKNILP